MAFCWGNEEVRYIVKGILNSLKIGYAIVDLIKQRDEIENFNKKALYILIREMTNVNTSQITSVVNTLKKHYRKISNEYHKHGIITNKGSKFFM